MIGVAQNDLRLDVISQLGHVHSLDSPHRAHRHENGGLDLAMVGRYESGTRIGALGCGYELIVHSVSVLKNRAKLVIFLVFGL